MCPSLFLNSLDARKLVHDVFSVRVTNHRIMDGDAGRFSQQHGDLDFSTRALMLINTVQVAVAAQFAEFVVTQRYGIHDAPVSDLPWAIVQPLGKRRKRLGTGAWRSRNPRNGAGSDGNQAQ